MPTGQIIINNALTALGILEQGGTPSVSDSVDTLAELNAMWEAWGIDEGLIYAQQSIRGALAALRGVYTLGSGAAINVPRPSRLYSALVLGAVSFAGTTAIGNATITGVASTAGIYVGQHLVGAGIPQGAVILSLVADTSVTIDQPATAAATVTLYATNGNRTELEIIEANRYYAHNDLAAAANTPDELYPDFAPDASGFMRVYLFPLPKCLTPSLLELDAAVAFTAWVLGTNYMLPPGFQDAIQYALAWRCLPRFGAAVQPQVAEVIGQLGQKAEARIRAMNAINRQKPAPEQVAPAAEKK